jgi:hypothetical protein
MNPRSIYFTILTWEKTFVNTLSGRFKHEKRLEINHRRPFVGNLTHTSDEIRRRSPPETIDKPIRYVLLYDNTFRNEIAFRFIANYDHVY